MFENIIIGINMMFSLGNFFAALAGVTIGMFFGAIPGFNDIIAIILILPFTYYINPIASIAMLMGCSKGANFGGSIPAILFNVPGTTQAKVTSFDGYPLTKKGQSEKALKVALYASTIADTASDFILFFLAAPVSILALMVGPPEYAMIILFSILIIGLVGSEDLVKGMISIGIGMLLSTIGMDPAIGSLRFTFGSLELSSGISLVSLGLGLFVISESFLQLESCIMDKKIKSSKKIDKVTQFKKVDQMNDQHLSKKEFRRCIRPIINGIGIGSLMGAIPGIGTTVASYLSYARTKNTSKHPELFGKGAIEGIAAAEAGNNACVGPNLIPLITLGVPGNMAAAIILGAFMIQGLTPGPLFMQQNAPMLYGLFTLLIISNVFTFSVGSLFIRSFKNLAYIPKQILYPLVLVFTVVGTYIFNYSMFDVVLLFPLGIFGYVLTKINIPIPPLVIAFILGSIFETRLRQALIISAGSISPFFTHPISLIFLSATILTILFYIIKRQR